MSIAKKFYTVHFISIYKIYLKSLAYFWKQLFYTFLSFSSFAPLPSMFFVWSFVNSYCKKLNTPLFGASFIIEVTRCPSGFCTVFLNLFFGEIPNYSKLYIISPRTWVWSNFNLAINTVTEATIVECVCNFIVHCKYWIALEVEKNRKSVQLLPHHHTHSKIIIYFLLFSIAIRYKEFIPSLKIYKP